MEAWEKLPPAVKLAVRTLIEVVAGTIVDE